jgi:hypothetical protein
VRLVELIQAARSSIEVAWKEMRLAEAQRRAAFPAFFVGAEGFTDEVFLAHEAFLPLLAAELEGARPILRAVEKREAILAERVE